MEHCTKLRIAREAKNLTQAQAGELLGMDQRQISRYEQGKQDPSATKIIEFCKAYQISADWLLGLTEK